MMNPYDLAGYLRGLIGFNNPLFAGENEEATQEP